MKSKEFLEYRTNYYKFFFNILSNLFLLLVIIHAELKGQIRDSDEGFSQFSLGLPAEKVYVHLDRPNYMQGDTIWFKLALVF